MILMPDLLSKRHIRTLSNHCKSINILCIYISWEETYACSVRFSQKKQDGMHPIQYRFGATVSRPCVVGQERTSLRKRCIRTAKLRILLKTTAKDGGFFTFAPILLR